MKTSDFSYDLPPRFIAQTAAEPRDSSRLIVLNRSGGALEHRYFYELGDYLKEGDVVVCNDSRVIPARLYGKKREGGGQVELLILRRLEQGIWEALARPGRRLKTGSRIEVGDCSVIQAEILEKGENGTVVVKFDDEQGLGEAGVVPLPPYIKTPLCDTERYQTVYSREKGSVAAPTAGLHFTPGLMNKLQEKGVRFAFITLHLALDSFRPVQTDDPRDHIIHREYGAITLDTASEICQAKSEGRRIVCVGTSTVRTLEHVARTGDGQIRAFNGWMDLFIIPGHRFQVVDALITNFHLPCSTLLMLVSAFAGRERVLDAYREAMKHSYRFYSFGDAMLII